MEIKTANLSDTTKPSLGNLTGSWRKEGGNQSHDNPVFIVENNQVQSDGQKDGQSGGQKDGQSDGQDAERGVRQRQRVSSKKSKMVIYCVMLFLNMMSFGFIKPLNIVYVDVIEDMNVTRAEASLIMSITRGVMFGSGFISSWVYYMIGPIKCIAFGGIIFSVGLLFSSFANQMILIALPFGILSGFGGSLINLAGISVVANTFVRHKAVALSYSTMGSGVAGMIFPYMFEVLIQKFSWRGTIIIYSGLVLNTIPAAYLMKINTHTQTKREKGNRFDFEVFKILEYRLYVAATLLFGTFGLAANFFIVDLAVDKGISRAEAVNFVSVLGVSSLVGRLLFGSIRQFAGFRGIDALPFNSLILAGASVSFAYCDQFWSLLISCIVCGLAYGVQFIMIALAPLE